MRWRATPFECGRTSTANTYRYQERVTRRVIITCPAISGPTDAADQLISWVQTNCTGDPPTCRSNAICKGDSSGNVSILGLSSAQRPRDSRSNNVHPTPSIILPIDEISIMSIVTKPDAKNTSIPRPTAVSRQGHFKTSR
jgi:hypothetical protein